MSVFYIARVIFHGLGQWFIVSVFNVVSVYRCVIVYNVSVENCLSLMVYVSV